MKTKTYVDLATEAHSLERAAEAMGQHLQHAAAELEQRQRGRALLELRRARDIYCGLFMGQLNGLIAECEKGTK